MTPEEEAELRRVSAEADGPQPALQPELAGRGRSPACPDYDGSGARRRRSLLESTLELLHGSLTKTLCPLETYRLPD